MSFFAGLVAAVISILGWGSYFVPMKRMKEYDPFYFQFLMCIAIFVSSLIIVSFYNSFVFSYMGILSGILWSLGNILAILSVKNSGLSRAAPVWMGTAISVSFLWGVMFFKEMLSSMVNGIVGIFFLLAGISIISLIMESKKTSLLKGIMLAVVAGLLFGTYLVPYKLSGLGPETFLFSMSIGILIGGLFIFSIKRPEVNRKITIPGASSGIIWNIANFASFFAVLNLGIAVGFPLTQVALFVSVLWGLLYFREIKGRKNITRLMIGAAILFIGAVLLALSI